ncbi:hypothetical protein PRZ48_003406 [Zasmidium cellare]|uniref:Alpha/beta hydrolase fold-3 domain-containing protein n=1 Tax=Zasmidium cellare TaxID=395010 RepID=A0ABR0EW91_ZASCE|nr:hypothetical protein PRZ48_003406 [Zasmidium cellare]
MAAKFGLNPGEKQRLRDTVITTNFKPPGRLGDPNLKFFQEPRAHPKIVETFTAFGIDGSQPNPFAGMRWDDLSSARQMAQNHATMAKLYEMLPNDLPEDSFEPEVQEITTTFKSFDGTERTLYIFRRKDLNRELPAILYTHGGSMTILDAGNKVHKRWCRSLAVQGVVAVAVDFRNAWTPQGPNPFPIGLKDCTSAFQYIVQHKAELGIDKIVLHGDNGGANLALATALKAKKEGWVSQIAGVYGLVPYISNAYGWGEARKLKELPSLYECEGYWLYTAMLAGMGYYYSGDEAEHPLAWPYFATVDECRGLPPHVLSMDELDPLRDEGLAYYRKLLAAGVEVTAQVNLGVVHGSAVIFRKLLPEVHNKAIKDVAAFAKSL